MSSKKVKQIIGIGVIIVVIAGVVFMFTRLNKPAEPVQEMQTAPKFMTEETVDNPALLEEERTWEEVIPSKEMTLKTITDTYLHVQPFADTDTTIKVPINSEFIEEATCFQGSVPLNWSKVTYNGTTGYVELCDTEYVEQEVEEVVEVEENEESLGVSQDDQHSIVEVNEPDETVEPTATPEPTEEPKTTETPRVDATPTPAPTPTPTQNPNVTVKTEEQKQSELHDDATKKLQDLGIFDLPAPAEGSGFGTTVGDGTHFGDAQ